MMGVETLGAANRTLRRLAARQGWDLDYTPREMPELEDLRLPAWAPGEEPPAADAGRLWYGPDGLPIEWPEGAGLWIAGRRDPANWWRSGSFYRAGERIEVSTVFVGVDMGFLGFREGGPPILWETMVFQEGRGTYQWRYATRAAARAGHVAVVTAIREAQRARRAAWAPRARAGLVTAWAGGPGRSAPSALPGRRGGLTAV